MSNPNVAGTQANSVPPLIFEPTLVMIVDTIPQTHQKYSTQLFRNKLYFVPANFGDVHANYYRKRFKYLSSSYTQQSTAVVVLLLRMNLSLLLFITICTLAYASDDSCTFSRVRPNPEYSYADNAASLWPQQKPEYSLCGSGKRQSPINVRTEHYIGARPPTITHNLSVLKYNPDFHNFHWNCSHQFGTCGTLKHRNRTANLVQVHPHSPSENLIDGARYPLELHFVHATANGAISVVAVLFKAGRFNPQLQHLLDAANRRHFAVVDLPLLSGVATSNLCSFDGSLTTPPCVEGVRWYVSLDVKEASLAQIGRYREFVEESPNSRPTQKTNGRNVVCYVRGRRKVEQ